MEIHNIILSFDNRPDLRWKDSKYTSIDKGYEYSRTDMLYDENNIYIRMKTYYRTKDGICYMAKAPKGSKAIPSYYITVHEFRKYTAQGILSKLDEYGNRNRMTEDLIFKLFNDLDLDLGFTVKHLKNIRRWI